MDDQDLVLARELDDLLEEPVGDDRARGVVRVVDEHQARALQRLGVERVRSGAKPSSGSSGSSTRLGAGQERAAGVDRVAGIRGEGDVARVEEGEAEVVDALLGADRRDHLGLGVDLDAEAPVVEVGERAPELLPASVRRVVVGAGVGHRGLHRLDDVRKGRMVGIADPQADHVDAGRPLVGDLALELGEHVGRDRLEALGWVGEGHRPSRLAARADARPTNPQGPGRTPATARRRTRATAEPVRVTSSSGPISTVSSPPSSSTVIGLARHARNAATAAPLAPVPDESVSPTPRSKIRARTVEPSARQNETFVRFGKSSCSPRSPGPNAPGRAPRGRPPTSIAHCGFPTLTCWNAHSRPADVHGPGAVVGPGRVVAEVSDARPISIAAVPGPVIVGVTSPALVMIEKVSASVHPCERRYRTASRAPLPESSASDPSGLKIRSSATCAGVARRRQQQDPVRADAEVRLRRSGGSAPAVSSQGSSSRSTIT